MRVDNKNFNEDVLKNYGLLQTCIMNYEWVLLELRSHLLNLLCKLDILRFIVNTSYCWALSLIFK